MAHPGHDYIARDIPGCAECERPYLDHHPKQPCRKREHLHLGVTPCTGGAKARRCVSECMLYCNCCDGCRAECGTR